MKKASILSFILTMMVLTIQAKEITTIEDIINNPGLFRHQSIVFEGFVERYVRGPSTTTSYYEIKGEYGAVIKVITSEGSPEIFKRYRVHGILMIEGRDLYVTETRRFRVDNGPTLNITITPQGGGAILPSDRLNLKMGETVSLRANPSNNYRFVKWTQNGLDIGFNETLEYTMPGNNAFLEAHFKRTFPVMWVALGGLVVIAIVLAVLLLRPKPNPEQHAFEPFDPGPGVGNIPPPSPGADNIPVNPGQDYDTIRFEPDVPPTMQFIPGKLEILNGPDKGKTFMLAGYPTPDGSISSIGRDHTGWDNQPSLSGGRKYAHVRIKDDSRTLSRMQAELIYRNGKLYLKNLSAVNPSQVDGVDVAVNDVGEVKSGSKIKAGYIEFRYQE